MRDRPGASSNHRKRHQLKRHEIGEAGWKKGVPLVCYASCVRCRIIESEVHREKGSALAGAEQAISGTPIPKAHMCYSSICIRLQPNVECEPFIPGLPFLPGPWPAGGSTTEAACPVRES